MKVIVMILERKKMLLLVMAPLGEKITKWSPTYPIQVKFRLVVRIELYF